MKIQLTYFKKSLINNRLTNPAIVQHAGEVRISRLHITLESHDIFLFTERDVT